MLRNWVQESSTPNSFIFHIKKWTCLKSWEKQKQSFNTIRFGIINYTSLKPWEGRNWVCISVPKSSEIIIFFY